MTIYSTLSPTSLGGPTASLTAENFNWTWDIVAAGSNSVFASSVFPAFSGFAAAEFINTASQPAAVMYNLAQQFQIVVTYNSAPTGGMALQLQWMRVEEIN